MQPIDITHCWRQDSSTTSVVNHDLVDEPTVRVPGFSLPRAQWRTLNSFSTGQGRCASCLKKWGLSSSKLCACSDNEMTSYIVESCPVNKLDGGILSLHSADETVVQWLNTHLAWHIGQQQLRIINPCTNYRKPHSSVVYAIRLALTVLKCNVKICLQLSSKSSSVYHRSLKSLWQYQHYFMHQHDFNVSSCCHGTMIIAMSQVTHFQTATWTAHWHTRTVRFKTCIIIRYRTKDSDALQLGR